MSCVCKIHNKYYSKVVSNSSKSIHLLHHSMNGTSVRRNAELVEELLPLGVDGHVLRHVLVPEEHVLVPPHGGCHVAGQN